MWTVVVLYYSFKSSVKKRFVVFFTISRLHARQESPHLVNLVIQHWDEVTGELILPQCFYDETSNSLHNV
jgi:hypothetical protein